MTPNDINSLVGNLGFPIVACGFMGWLCYYMISNVNKTMSNMNVALAELSKSISNLSEKIKEHYEEDK